MNLAEAKLRIDIPALWTRFGFEGTPGKSCRCPWRKDRSPSFSVTDDTVWHDFATGEGGDTVSFYALASGLPIKEACRRFIALAGGSPLPATPRPPRAEPEDEERDRRARREQWPLFEEAAGNKEDFSLLAELRHVSLEGVRLMALRGLLFFTEWHGHRAWVVTDDSRKCAQVRRLDGLLWPTIQAKAWNLPGSEASRPIGAREAQQFPIVLFCEGAPDLLAAFHFVLEHGRQADVAAVCLLGARMKIHDASLPIFGGKRVRIFPHADEPGRAAAVRWAEQLAEVRALVDAVNFDGMEMEDGSPIEDLNDATRIAPNQKHELTNLLP